MAAIMPAPRDELGPNAHADLLDSDQDAEGEEDTDFHQLDQELQSAVQKADARDAVEDDGEAAGGPEFVEENRSEASVEDVNDDAASQDSENDDGDVDVDDDDDDEDFEGSRRLRPGRRGAGLSSKSDDEESDPDDAFENGLDAHSGSDSNSNESDAEAEDWDAESNGKDDNDGDKIARGNCM